jgi:hypothetical protein
MNRVVEVEIPVASKLFQASNESDFHDAYQASLQDASLSVQDAYRAVFGHTPRWVRALFAVRGVAARILGLHHPTRGQFQVSGDSYKVGQLIGLFIVQSIEPNELIVGADDKHLNIRVSILKSFGGGVASVTVSTVVDIHNTMGRLYMFVVGPFHRLLAPISIQSAVDAGRL